MEGKTEIKRGPSRKHIGMIDKLLGKERYMEGDLNRKAETDKKGQTDCQRPYV